MNAVLNAASINGKIGAGSISLSDYLLEVTPIENGHRLTVTRGSEVQTMDVLDGAAESVLYTQQALTSEQQTQARENISAAGKEELNMLLEVVPYAPEGETTENYTLVLTKNDEAQGFEMPSLAYVNEQNDLVRQYCDTFMWSLPSDPYWADVVNKGLAERGTQYYGLPVLAL